VRTTRTEKTSASMNIPRRCNDISEIKANLLLIKWMIGFNLAFTMAVVWRVFA